MPFLTRKFRPFTLAPLWLSLLVLTSCGGGGTASTSPDAFSTTSGTATTSQPANNAPAQGSGVASPVSSSSAASPSGSGAAVTTSTSPSTTATTQPTSNSVTPSSPQQTAQTSSTSNNSGPVKVAQYTFKADAGGYGTSPMTTPSVTTPASGSIILVQVLTQNPGTFAGLTDNKGNTYVNIGGPQTYAGDAGSYLYACVNAVGGANQTWSLTKPSGYGSNEASIYVVVLSGASGIGAWSYSNTRPYSGSAITTSAANSLVVSFWGPSDYTGGTNAYTPPAGWTKGNSNTNASNENTGADAWEVVPNAGVSVNPVWTSSQALGSSGTQGSMWLVEVKP